MLKFDNHCYKLRPNSWAVFQTPGLVVPMSQTWLPGHLVWASLLLLSKASNSYFPSSFNVHHPSFEVFFQLTSLFSLVFIAYLIFLCLFYNKINNLIKNNLKYFLCILTSTNLFTPVCISSCLNHPFQFSYLGTSYYYKYKSSFIYLRHKFC